MSKKLQEKQRKRLAEQMRRERQRKATRRSNLITIGIAVLVVGAVTAIILFSNSGGGGSVPDAPAGKALTAAGCDDIEEFKAEGQEHVQDGTTVDYETTPPTSGNHWATPAEPDFYTTPMDEERVVHNMEHGQVIIWYSPDADQETIDGIEGLVDSADDADNKIIKQGSAPPLLAVPYDQVPNGKNYVITAWTASQACTSYSEEAINAFREKYQGRGPEQVTAPFTG